MIKRNVSKISSVVKDLLFCTKERDPNFTPDVAPAEILEEVHRLYLPRAEEEGIALSLEIPEEPERGTYDAEGINTIVSNLVVNAIDACRFDPAEDRKQHAIKLSCAGRDPGAVVIGVSDNGSGIPEEVKHKVFKGFFSTKGTEGTGLGLLVVQKLVEEQGGRLSFTSKEGEGTSFEIVLRSQDAERIPQDEPGGDAAHEQRSLTR
jgi:signal transduction histidine kinase